MHRAARFKPPHAQRGTSRQPRHDRRPQPILRLRRAEREIHLVAARRKLRPRRTIPRPAVALRRARPRPAGTQRLRVELKIAKRLRRAGSCASGGRARGIALHAPVRSHVRHARAPRRHGRARPRPRPRHRHHRPHRRHLPDNPRPMLPEDFARSAQPPSPPSARVPARLRAPCATIPPAVPPFLSFRPQRP